MAVRIIVVAFFALLFGLMLFMPTPLHRSPVTTGIVTAVTFAALVAAVVWALK